jgi:hypothetical protein
LISGGVATNTMANALRKAKTISFNLVPVRLNQMYSKIAIHSM